MVFYDKMPDMECLVGDTMPKFSIEIEGNLSGCSMKVIIAKANEPTKAVISKECESVSDGFEVTLTHEDTSKLIGETAYRIHFEFTDAEGGKYKKLYGNLLMRSVPRGV